MTAAESGPDRLVVCHREAIGHCVLSLAPFAKGEVVDRFSGEIGPELRQHSLQVRPGLHISDTRFVGFLSHGCDPNCRLDMERLELVALRGIAAGDLLTIDYAETEDVLFRQFACQCGARTCRGWITGRLEDANEDGLRRMADGGKSAGRSSVLAGDAAWWTREDLHYRAGRLRFAGCDVATMAAEVEEPLYLYSLDRVEANLDRVLAALGDVGCEAGVYYAMKANRFRPLLERLAQSGKCGIDICSPGELDLALSCGFAPGRISFTGCGVSRGDLATLLRHPDLSINCDTIGMIRRIGESSPGREIGIRVNPGLGTGYGDGEKLTYAGGRTTKFGIYREQWSEALATAREFGLKVTGLHFHVGCGYLTDQLEQWSRAIGAALRFLDEVPEVRTVNVGGGLGLPHRVTDQPLDLARWSSILRDHFAGRGVRIAVEPGDYIVKDAGMLVLRVTDVEWKRDTRFVSVNGGFNLHPEPAFYDLPCEPAPCVLRGKGTNRQTVTIAGNINEALDIWAADIALQPVEEGDAIAFLNAGGYGVAMSSNHCLRGSFRECAI
ncbi:SET domain-containing protein-lysine N-methyltransferase [Novosphingobium mangrovi (ex Huang et al. 2023)]|uniref:Diaminopimelate decarboxylase n=1 Tax=Novosphingobium mangrovi (ex Huang et al. 2023) TaxID=2976432 RepID=A0ABT2I9P3_9SPHN|nr:SET domain-containing protein-lysine N-methyltransferase [Novosphingobium mangrovi (ex Huang et al. 2023)]MCT2401534.1 diaminopimelate decarboxylase [Novosphingobium mangrovi (ex Huang et al. 2023)]